MKYSELEQKLYEEVLDKVFEHLSRVEVIEAGTGRVYVKNRTGDVTYSLQDDARTLKIFVKGIYK